MCRLLHIRSERQQHVDRPSLPCSSQRDVHPSPPHSWSARTCTVGSEEIRFIVTYKILTGKYDMVRHYAGVSTDLAYVKPAHKQIDGATCSPQCISEWDMFRMLDSLRPTSAGLDGLPAWYLKIAAPIFCNHDTSLQPVAINVNSALSVERSLYSTYA